MSYIKQGIEVPPHAAGDVRYNYLEDEPVVDTTAGDGSIVVVGTAGENIAFGNVVYLDTSGEWTKADADASTSVGMLGLALETILSGADGLILLQGFVRDDSWTWTDGGVIGQIYISTTAGVLTQTAPSGSGDQVQVAGYAHTATVMYFNPSPNVIGLPV